MCTAYGLLAQMDLPGVLAHSRALPMTTVYTLLLLMLCYSVLSDSIVLACPGGGWPAR